MTPMLDQAVDNYVKLVDEYDVPPEEARQVLPNACGVNIIWTVNMTSLYNFLTQRICKRNVAEMQQFACYVHRELTSYWPEFAGACGPYCYPSGVCNQGKMSCGQPYKKGELV